MTNKEQTDIIKEKITYQRAVYRFHETDDEELKKHFRGIIKSYEAKYGTNRKAPQMMLPGFKEFDGRGLA